VLDPPGGDETAPVETQEPVVEDKTWVDRIWEFLSGQDMGPSG